MEPLRVAYIIDQLECGGAERVLITLANIFYENGHKATVIATVAPGSIHGQLSKDVRFICLDRKWKWNPFTMYKLIKELRKNDIIHVHSSHNLKYVWLAGKIFFLHKPIFFHEHFGDIEIDRSVRLYQRIIYPQTFMICVSSKIVTWAIENLNIKKERVFLLSNIIVQKKNVSLPSIFKKEKDILQLILVSNFRATKNILFAIKLFAELKRVMDCRLTIIGKIADTVYYKKFLENISQTEINSFITVINDCNEVQEHLHAYHAALHTARSESGPLVLLEYMAQKLPFLASDKGEIAHQVKQAIPGIIMPSFNVQEWVIALQNLLSNQQEIKDNLEDLFNKISSPENYYKECLAIYEKGLAAYYPKLQSPHVSS